MKKEKEKKSAKTADMDFENDIVEIKPKRKSKTKYALLYVAIIGFVCYAVITIVNQNVKIAEKRSELQQLQQQVNVVEIQSQYLEKVQNYEGDELDNYRKKIAKEKLGFISEGERIFINVAGN